MNDVLSAAELRRQALRDALAELRSVEERHRHLSELASIWERRRQVEAEIVGRDDDAAAAPPLAARAG